MPVAPTFPGVYIEEVPSGVRTIVGVATNIAAFLGRAVAGTPNQATVINGFADFERQFGGLDIDYPMSYSVSDFFQNGGSQAIIVRLTGSAGEAAKLTINGLNLVANSAGTWGKNLHATVDETNITDDIAKRYGLTTGDLFNLTVSEVVNGRTISQERFLNLSIAKDDAKIPAIGRALRIDRVLAQSSQLVRLGADKSGNPDLPAKNPAAAAATPPATPAAPAATAAPAPVSAVSGGADDTSLSVPDLIGDPAQKTGIFALDGADLFNMLVIPPDTANGDIDLSVYGKALDYCVKRRAMLIVDSPSVWSKSPVTAANDAFKGFQTKTIQVLHGDAARNAAMYFPRVQESDPLSNGQIGTYALSGIVAGIMARTDVNRGVWKAPAGIDATLNGIVGLDVNLTNEENGQLNPLGLNCLRSFPVFGSVVWGARTLAGADQLADDYKYVPVRRLALFIEESLYRGTQWVVFEPNDEPLWAQIRLNVGAFMHNLFVKRAFQGQAPADAYFVRCDKNTTPQNAIDLGIVNIIVGFAPLKPAEFVIIQIQQIAGSIAT